MKNLTDYIINERGPAPIFPTGHEDPCCIMIQTAYKEITKWPVKMKIKQKSQKAP